MKIKSCIDELNEKNININIINDKNNLLNNLSYIIWLILIILIKYNKNYKKNK